MNFGGLGEGTMAQPWYPHGGGEGTMAQPWYTRAGDQGSMAEPWYLHRRHEDSMAQPGYPYGLHEGAGPGACIPRRCFSCKRPFLRAVFRSLPTVFAFLIAAVRKTCDECFVRSPLRGKRTKQRLPQVKLSLRSWPKVTKRKIGEPKSSGGQG